MKGPSRIVCFFGRGDEVMMGKLYVSLAGEAVIQQWGGKGIKEGRGS